MPSAEIKDSYSGAGISQRPEHDISAGRPIQYADDDEYEIIESSAKSQHCGNAPFDFNYFGSMTLKRYLRIAINFTMGDNDMTRQINVGGVLIGGGAPVSVQSMCSTRTDDYIRTAEQINALGEAGCDIVRCTVPTMEAAKALEE